MTVTVESCDHKPVFTNKKKRGRIEITAVDGVTYVHQYRTTRRTKLDHLLSLCEPGALLELKVSNPEKPDRRQAVSMKAVG